MCVLSSVLEFLWLLSFFRKEITKDKNICRTIAEYSIWNHFKQLIHIHENINYYMFLLFV